MVAHSLNLGSQCSLLVQDSGLDAGIGFGIESIGPVQAVSAPVTVSFLFVPVISSYVYRCHLHGQ